MTGNRATELRCVFFGDSITAGQYVSPNQHWTALLRERLTDLEMTHVLFSVGAVSGDTTRQGLERFPTEVQSERPDVITIQFGLNDCNRWQTDGGLPRVSELAFDGVRIPDTHLIEERRRHSAKAVAGHLILGIAKPS